MELLCEQALAQWTEMALHVTGKHRNIETYTITTVCTVLTGHGSGECLKTFKEIACK